VRRILVFYTQGLVAGDGSSGGLWRLKKTRAHGDGKVQIVGSKGAEIIPGAATERLCHLQVRPSASFRTDFGVFQFAAHRHTHCFRHERERLRARNCHRRLHAGHPLHGGARGGSRPDAGGHGGEPVRLDQKYADVVSAAEALDYLQRFPLKN
jgi:hypothetical protein